MSEKDNTHFWDKQCFLWFSLIFIYPLGLALLWFNTDCDKDLKKKMSIGFGIIFLAVLLFNTGKSDEKVNTQPQVAVTSTTNSTKATPAETTTDISNKLAAFPDSIEGTKEYIISAIDDKYKGKANIDVSPSTNTQGGYLIEVTITANDLNLEQSYMMARNVIVATYDAVYEKNLPVIYVSYRTEDERGKRIFIIGIGKNVADKVSRDKWNVHTGNNVFSPDGVISFARSNQEQAISEDGKTHFENRCFIK